MGINFGNGSPGSIVRINACVPKNKCIYKFLISFFLLLVLFLPIIQVNIGDKCTDDKKCATGICGCTWRACKCVATNLGKKLF
jgi:hypothetical protein